MITPEQQAKEDLNLFLGILPPTIKSAVEATGREDELLELVMDLGRQPMARFVDGEQVLREEGVMDHEIKMIVDAISDFDDDNRAGIARTLHRISGIRNRKGDVIGLTCRIGRPVYGTLDIISDIVEMDESVLILGAPGVGKTTMLREMARLLSDDVNEKRVIIVDTSNEIGGDGDVPHPAVGRARRMQVPRPSHQHETMIEGVENHNPEVIIIDEIGREEEASAARTINERGVRLIGTAHGRTLENLLLNPTLSDLVGGIESVTLSDDEARRRGTQKTVLERRAPPTFDILIEIQERQRLVLHRNVAASVDAMLRGRSLSVEVRYRDEDGQIQIESQQQVMPSQSVTGRRADLPERVEVNPEKKRSKSNGKPKKEAVSKNKEEETPQKSMAIYSYGVARNRLQDAATKLGVKVIHADSLEAADAVVTLKSYYRKQRKLLSTAEQMKKPVYILRANTVTQMENFLAETLNVRQVDLDPFETAIAEANEAIDKIRAGAASVDLPPCGTALRRYQHQMARQANFVAHSYGREPDRHVRIFNVPRNESIPGA